MHKASSDGAPKHNRNHVTVEKIRRRFLMKNCLFLHADVVPKNWSVPQPACPSAPHLGPIWATSWGPYGQPRWARCPFGRGLHVRPKWAAHELAYMGLVWGPLGQPIMGCQYGPHLGSPDGRHVGRPRWARCPFGRGLHVRPKWAAHELAYMGLVWAPLGQPRWAPCRQAQMGSMSIWPRAPCQPQMGSP